MPYIKEENRLSLDRCIKEMVLCIESNADINTDQPTLSNEEFLSIVGDINYTFSRIITNLMGKPSYPKIAIVTGVLENIKQEFYRRLASPYEDKKTKENGDIPEYSIYKINKPYF